MLQENSDYQALLDTKYNSEFTLTRFMEACNACAVDIFRFSTLAGDK